MAIYKDVSSLEVVGYTVPKNGTFEDGVQFILEKLDTIPEADVEPVVHGRWIKYERYAVDSDGKPVLKTSEEYECSLCGRIEEKEEPYCNCGAKMDGKENRQ